MSAERKSMTLHRLRAMHAAGEKIAMLTCHDASFARRLALSSRNGDLDAVQRAEAAALSRALRGIANQARAGRRDWPAFEQEAMAFLVGRGWQPDCVAIRRSADLGPPAQGDGLVGLAAARLGSTRLIDNLEFDVMA